MDSKEQEKYMPALEFNKDNQLNDYKFLVQKLKSIKKIIALLEKNFLEKGK
tara:strand:- start:466 stop:618 length:153 start_codon:yes stop_codon:yes gene_type:complete